jgi:hypothetical protein
MRTVIELSDGLASNSFGTHLGYGVALGLRLHWIEVNVTQDLSMLQDSKAEEELKEWHVRQRLSTALRLTLQSDQQLKCSYPGKHQRIMHLLNPFWGFDCVHKPAELASLLVGMVPQG